MFFKKKHKNIKNVFYIYVCRYRILDFTFSGYGLNLRNRNFRLLLLQERQFYKRNFRFL